MHAVIDSFSQRILSWRIAGTFDPANMIATLLDASGSRSAEGNPPTVVADGGVENVNRNIDELIGSGLLRRVLAMTELWWRSLKHNWLFLNTLDSVDTVRKLAAFYVTEHNRRLPHSAFCGQTPDEMYLGKGGRIPAQLDDDKNAARVRRLETNRALSCRKCDPTEESAVARWFTGTVDAVGSSGNRRSHWPRPEPPTTERS